jgi:hypothetical protein
MRAWPFILALLSLASPAWALGEDPGADAGWLVFSVAACKGPPAVNLDLTLGPEGGARGETRSVSPNGAFAKRDFEEPPQTFGAGPGPAAKPPCTGVPLTGVVEIYRLKPGDYRLTWKVATVGSEIGAFRDSGAEIAVRPGRTVYLGEFVAVETRTPYMTSQLIFSVADRHDRDLGIAHLKTPDIGPADAWRDPTAVLTGPQPIYVR